MPQDELEDMQELGSAVKMMITHFKMQDGTLIDKESLFQAFAVEMDRQRRALPVKAGKRRKRGVDTAAREAEVCSAGDGHGSSADHTKVNGQHDAKEEVEADDNESDSNDQNLQQDAPAKKPRKIRTRKALKITSNVHTTTFTPE